MGPERQLGAHAFLMRYFFALAISIVCFRASLAIPPLLTLYRVRCQVSLLTIAAGWTLLCLGCAAAAFWLVVTA